MGEVNKISKKSKAVSVKCNQTQSFAFLLYHKEKQAFTAYC